MFAAVSTCILKLRFYSDLNGASCFLTLVIAFMLMINLILFIRLKRRKKTKES